jgi:hypothetical protein
MFITIVLDIENQKSDVLKTHTNRKDAINYLYNYLQELDNQQQIELEKDENVEFVKQYEKDIGFVYTVKRLTFVYQIIEYKPESELTKEIKKQHLKK